MKVPFFFGYLYYNHVYKSYTYDLGLFIPIYTKKMWQQFKGSKEAKIKNMATLYLINFPEFSESKEILKIGRSEVCVLGGGAKGRTTKLSLSVVL